MLKGNYSTSSFCSSFEAVDSAQTDLTGEFLNNVESGKKCLVSVIVPVYNREKLVVECLDSVLNQTLQDFEVIVVDDGSCDNTVNVCRQYQSKDPRVKVLVQAHKGASAARNLGRDNANGEFIYFLDSDDTINNIFLEAACQNAIENDSDVVFIDYVHFDWTLTIDKVISTSTCGLFYRKSFLDCMQLRFNEGVVIFEDSLFTFEALCLTDKRSLCLNSVYNYRFNPNSISYNWSVETSVKNCATYLTELKTFLDKHDLWDKYASKLKVYLEYLHCINVHFTIFDIFSKRKIYYMLKNFYYENAASHISEEEYNKFHFKIRRIMNSPNFLVYEIKDVLLGNKLIHFIYLLLRKFKIKFV